MINVIVVAIIVICALWVYWDATGNKIGKIPGAGGMLNMSAGAFAAVTMFLWIVGFPAYLSKRSAMIERAKGQPVEVKGRTLKMAILAVIGGLWVLVTLAGAMVPPPRASEASREPLREKVRNAVEQKGTLATSDVAFESPDGYRILIPNGYIYSKPTGTLGSLMAIKNIDTSSNRVVTVGVTSSNATNEEFSDQFRKGLRQKNSTTKFTEPVEVKNGSTEIERVEMTWVNNKNEPVMGIMLFASNAGKNYVVILVTKEELFSASKPELDRIANSFLLSKQEEKSVATQQPSVQPTQATNASQTKSVNTAPTAPSAAALDKPTTATPSAPSASDRKADARARAGEELVAQRRAAIEREQEAKRPLKATQGACVYKPVMTDEDIAKCR
jgi:hypothetical protein